MGRRYGLRGPWVLRGLGLDLPAHTVVRIEGANGAGKSTLLRLLAGIDAPTEGRVTGRPRAAYVPERFPAALPFTAAGYLVHMGRVHGLPTAEATARAHMWLARFGAAEHAATPLDELSKGTGQKVAVSQALLAGPELLVLDEAWTGLDAMARGELDRAVAERVADGGTVVFVDHDPRRLAGSVRAAYRLEGRTLLPATAPPADPGPRVRIEATCGPPAVLPPGLPGTPEVERDAGDPAAIRLTTTAAHSDPLLRALITARPPWHITGLSRLPAPVDPSAPGTAPPRDVPDAAPHRAAVGPVPGRAPVPVAEGTPAPGPESVPGRARTAVAPARGTAAVTRYQAALLARSQRWLAPVLLYAAVLGIGVRAGQPLLDSLGYAAAALLPVAAWVTRLCVTQEPRAARAVTAAAVGPSRAHLASLLTGLVCALALGGAGAVIVLLISEPVSTDRTVAVPLLPAALAGALAAASCALLGTAVGALCARPVVHRRGWSLAATLLGSLLALVADGSPAEAAVTGLVSGSLTGAVRVPLLPLAGAVAVAAAAAALTSRLAALRE
ncbi:ATP-binding cassette domain-containing protein [Streptomyces sp. NPDC057287]|uniref:ATP-binding cassette domain-containing protein n=1 Tax=Streptomyces sp. NPDC057287 TaxID=3346086 RepID=UPI00363211FC